MDNSDNKGELENGMETCTIDAKKIFVHKTFEERLAEYNGEISFYEFAWGEE